MASTRDQLLAWGSVIAEVAGVWHDVCRNHAQLASVIVGERFLSVHDERPVPRHPQQGVRRDQERVCCRPLRRAFGFFRLSWNYHLLIVSY